MAGSGGTLAIAGRSAGGGRGSEGRRGTGGMEVMAGRARAGRSGRRCWHWERGGAQRAAC